MTIKLTDCVRLRRIFFMHFLTRVSPRLPRYGIRIQILGLSSFSWSKELSCSRWFECLSLSLAISKDLMARGNPFQDINALSLVIWFSNNWLLLQIIEARWNSDLAQVVLRGNGSKLVKLVYWPVCVLLWWTLVFSIEIKMSKRWIMPYGGSIDCKLEIFIETVKLI